MSRIRVIFLCTLISSGLVAQWQIDDVRISDTYGSSMTGWAGGRNIAADSDNVHIAWVDYSETQRIRYVRFPIDTPPEPGSGLAVNESYGFSASVTTDGHNAHVCWYAGTSPSGAREHDGSGWGQTIDGCGMEPATADDLDGNTHCVYNSSHWGGVSYAVYNWSGAVEGMMSPTIGGFPSDCLYPAICISPDEIIHVTAIGKSYPFTLYYNSFNGIGWQELISVVDDAYFSTGSSVCSDSDNRLYVAYRSTVYPYNVFVVKIDSSGAYEPQMVSSGLGYNHDCPSIAADNSGNIWVFWCEYRATTDYCYEIFYNRLDAATGIWDGPNQLTANDGGDSRWPHVAADGRGGIHVCWSDERDGNENLPELYYNWLPGDNDSIPDTTLIDLSLTKVIRPWIVEHPGTPFTPECEVYNNQDTTVHAQICCVIYDSLQTVYADTVSNWPLDTGYNQVAGFMYFVPQEGSQYNAMFRVTHPDDVNPDNDFRFQYFSTSLRSDVTPYLVDRPQSLEDALFAPQVRFAERSGLTVRGVVAKCSIKKLSDNSTIYVDSIAPQIITPYDSIIVVFSYTPGLTSGEDYEINFWASDSTGEVISYPVLTKYFRYEAVGIAEAGSYRYFLRSITPNPCRDFSRVSFSLPAQTVVNLNVYDITGRRVTSLASGTFGAGVHHLRWDSSDLSDGVYFLRMETSEFKTTRKLVVID